MTLILALTPKSEAEGEWREEAAYSCAANWKKKHSLLHKGLYSYVRVATRRRTNCECVSARKAVSSMYMDPCAEKSWQTSHVGSRTFTANIILVSTYQFLQVYYATVPPYETNYRVYPLKVPVHPIRGYRHFSRFQFFESTL